MYLEQDNIMSRLEITQRVLEQMVQDGWVEEVREYRIIDPNLYFSHLGNKTVVDYSEKLLASEAVVFKYLCSHLSNDDETKDSLLREFIADDRDRRKLKIQLLKRQLDMKLSKRKD